MKKFAFISDFDGTLSQRDFYHIIIDKYLGERGRQFYNEWKKTKKINVEFLNKIFGSINLTEEELYGEILQIPLDVHAEAFIRKVQANSGDFYILSAGTSYYIKLLLAQRKIENVRITSMEGCYKNGGIEITPDVTDTYYSPIFGVDKGRFVSDRKREYDMVFYAGDSEPDLNAAKEANIAFAKSELQDLLDKEQTSYVAVSDFKQIDDYMTIKGWLK